MSIEEIIQGCINNDRICQKALFDRMSSNMLMVCMRYARHRLEAEDMLQEGMINVYMHIKQYNGKGSFEGWVKRIIINSCLKELRKMSFKNEDLGIDSGIETKIDPTVFAKLSEKDLLDIIQTLPNGYRMVFNLYAIEGFTHKEIAKALNIEEGTSRSQLLKARKLLKKIINKPLSALI